jgi:peptidoglycan hydrolase CwlO-like protein
MVLNMYKSTLRTAIASAAILPIVLSGCAVDKAGCDPAAVRNAGFFTKLSCDVSGSYDARAQDQQAKLSQAQYENQALNSLLSELQAQNRDLQAGITVKRSERDRLVRDMNQYLAQIKAQTKNDQAIEQQIGLAQKELDRLQNLPAQASATQQQAQLQKLEQQIKNLRTMLP